jgi:uncharacterized protein with FMN-binding domain
MRRAAAAIGVTVVGLWLILSFKSSPVRPTAVNTLPPSSTVTAPEPATTLAAPTTGIPAATGPPPPNPTNAPTTTIPVASGATRTVAGDVIATRYGDVQVAAVLSGTRIVDVKALQLPFDRARSQDISNQAAPLLHDEALQAQSAQIDTIGGATYTSDGYARSLQSALDRARA